MSSISLSSRTFASYVSDDDSISVVSTPSLTSSSTTSPSGSTDSTSAISTVWGPGTLAGKGVLALGKATLRGVEWIAIKRRLRTIGALFPHTGTASAYNMERVYDDILELSRAGMYPDKIRAQALRFVLMQIACGVTEDLMSSLLKWPPEEMQCFFSDLLTVMRMLWSESRLSYRDQTLLTAYFDSLSTSDDHSANPIVEFIHEVLNGDLALSRPLIAAGFLDIMITIHAGVSFDRLTLITSDSGRASPSSLLSLISRRQKRASLRSTCDMISSLFLADPKAYQLVLSHPVHLLWPSYCSSPMVNPFESSLNENRKAWRMMDRGIIECRLNSIYESIDDWSLHDQDQFDILEFSRRGIYPEKIRYLGWQIVLSQIASRETMRLIRCLSAWPIREVQTFMSELLSLMTVLWPGHGGHKDWGPASTYLDLLSPKESHSALPLVEFICQIAEVDRSMFEATSNIYLYKIIDLVAIQIAYRKADPLVPLLRWPPVELQKLVSNLIGLLYQLWNHPSKHFYNPRPELYTAYIAWSTKSDNHPAIPLVDFISNIVRSHTPARRACLKAKFLDLMLFMYASGSNRDPSLYTACHACILALCTDQQCKIVVQTHPVYQLSGHTAAGDLCFPELVDTPLGEHRKAWRRVEIDYVEHRLHEITKHSRRGDLRDDDCADIVELSRFGSYPENVSTQARKLLVTHIARRDTFCFIRVLDDWPVEEIVLLLNSIADLLFPLCFCWSSVNFPSHSLQSAYISTVSSEERERKRPFVDFVRETLASHSEWASVLDTSLCPRCKEIRVTNLRLLKFDDV